MQFRKTNNADFLNAKCDELGKRHKSLSLRGKTGEEQLVHLTGGGAGREYAAFSGVAEKDQYLKDCRRMMLFTTLIFVMGFRLQLHIRLQFIYICIILDWYCCNKTDLASSFYNCFTLRDPLLSYSCSTSLGFVICENLSKRQLFNNKWTDPRFALGLQEP